MAEERLVNTASTLAALILLLHGAAGQAQEPRWVAARVRAWQEIKIPAQVAGVVVERPIARNSGVKAGDLLLRIDPTFHRINVRKAEAALQKAEAERAWADVEMKRAETLARTDAVNTAEVDRLRAQLHGAEATVLSAEAALEEAKELLLRTEVRAPVDGLVSEIHPEVGEMVSAGVTLAQMLTVQDLVAEAFVAPADAARFAKGKAVKVRIAPPLGAEIEGRVRELAGAAGSQRTFRLVIELPGAPSALKAGFDAQIRVPEHP